LDGTPVSVSVKDIMLWTQTVSYQQPQNAKAKLAARYKISSTKSIVVPINKNTAAKSGLNFTLEPSQSLKELISSAVEGGISLLDIETGPISHKGRAVIKVYVGKTYIGRIKILDGDPSTTNPDASHTFSMTLGKLGNITTALPSINKFDINFFAYGIDNDVLIRNLKFTLIK
jgi:hypothetical protein